MIATRSIDALIARHTTAKQARDQQDRARAQDRTRTFDAIDMLANRHALSMTQQQLADALGMGVTSIARMERGEQKVMMRTKLAVRALRASRGV